MRDIQFIKEYLNGRAFKDKEEVIERIGSIFKSLLSVEVKIERVFGDYTISIVGGEEDSFMLEMDAHDGFVVMIC